MEKHRKRSLFKWRKPDVPDSIIKHSDDRPAGLTIRWVIAIFVIVMLFVYLFFIR